MDPQGMKPLLTTKIVGSYLRHHTVGPTEFPNLITSVHRALTEAGRPNPPEVSLTPAVSVRQSVRHDYVICLDCGYQGKTLRRHISSRHGLSADEYLKRWGLRQDHLLTGPRLFTAPFDASKTTWSGSQTKGRGRSGGNADANSGGSKC